MSAFAMKLLSGKHSIHTPISVTKTTFILSKK